MILRREWHPVWKIDRMTSITATTAYGLVANTRMLESMDTWPKASRRSG